MITCSGAMAVPFLGMAYVIGTYGILFISKALG